MARIVFMGTPEFAVPSLDALADPEARARHGYELVGVVTQPDRPAGRGRRLVPSPVKQAALARGLPVHQPETLRSDEALARLRAWRPDLTVVVAFGQILRQPVLDLPSRGCLNVHASLLPRHRGAAPIPAAILAGDAQTGVSIMQMDAGLDTGPILSRRAEPILADDTAASLSDRLAALGAGLLVETLPRYLAGELRPTPQDHSQATYAGQLRKEDGRIDWTRPAEEIARQVRAFYPWPVAFAEWEGRPLKIIRALAQPELSAEPGVVFAAKSRLLVGCGQGAVELRQVQPPGRRPMSAQDFARGARNFVGASLVVQLHLSSA